MRCIAASDALDELDVFEPPMLGEHSLSRKFPHIECALTHDIQSAGKEGYVWDFRFESSDQNAKTLLSFEGISGVASLVRLIDLDTKMPHQLSDVSGIEINTYRGERNFRLVVGSLEFAVKTTWESTSSQKNSYYIRTIPTPSILKQSYVIHYRQIHPSTTFQWGFTTYWGRK